MLVMPPVPSVMPLPLKLKAAAPVANVRDERETLEERLTFVWMFPPKVTEEPAIGAVLPLQFRPLFQLPFPPSPSQVCERAGIAAAARSATSKADRLWDA